MPSLNVADYAWLISLIGSLGAAVAAFYAWRTASAMRKTILTQIVMEVTTSYSSPEMLEGMINLRAWQEKHGANFAKLFGEVRSSKKEYLISGEFIKIKDLDKDRRRYSHHFHQIRILLDTKIIDEKFAKKLVPRSQVDFLLQVIEPMEEALDPNYDHSTFNTFRKMYHKGGKANNKN